MEKNKVYVIQDVPGTREGRPKINIIGASQFGSLKVLLPENAQIILSAGPVVFKLLMVELTLTFSVIVRKILILSTIELH